MYYHHVGTAPDEMMGKGTSRKACPCRAVTRALLVSCNKGGWATRRSLRFVGYSNLANHTPERRETRHNSVCEVNVIATQYHCFRGPHSHNSSFNPPSHGVHRSRPILLPTDKVSPHWFNPSLQPPLKRARRNLVLSMRDDQWCSYAATRCNLNLWHLTSSNGR